MGQPILQQPAVHPVLVQQPVMQPVLQQPLIVQQPAPTIVHHVDSGPSFGAAVLGGAMIGAMTSRPYGYSGYHGGYHGGYGYGSRYGGSGYRYANKQKFKRNMCMARGDVGGAMYYQNKKNAV